MDGPRQPASLGARVTRWCRHYPYSVLGAVFAVGMLAQFCWRHDTEWRSVYVHTSRLLWSGEPVYVIGTTYFYPPFPAWVVYPFTVLSRFWGNLLWGSLNVVALAILVRGS